MTTGGARAALDVRLQVAAGHPVEPAAVARLDPRARRALHLAELVGAAVGPALDAAAAAQRDDRARRASIEVGTAQARFVSRALVALPLLLVPGLHVLLGIDLLGFWRTPAGKVVGAVALGLLAAGALASRALIGAVGRRPRRLGPAPCDEAADLLAAAVGAGLPPSAAVRAVGRVLPDHATALHAGALCLDQGAAVVAGTAVTDALDVLQLASRLGAPAAAELRALAAAQRADEDARIRARAERLPAQLALPSVLLLLPATVLLLGAPIVATAVPS